MRMYQIGLNAIVLQPVVIQTRNCSPSSAENAIEAI